jgi:hypothetical protein
MQKQELYLGKEVDPESGELRGRLELPSADLLTHGFVVGMTGSGKTGLGIALIEEVLRQGVPVIAIDPKGDLGNLLLLFDEPKPSAFEPWIDVDAARREGRTVAEAAQVAADSWSKGWAEWGLTPGDAAELAKGRTAVIYTPGSRAGVPLNILQSLEAPTATFESAEEDLRDEIAGIVSGLLGLVQAGEDGPQSKEAVFLANLIERVWRAGQGLTLENLVGAVAEPPFDKIGALPLEKVYPRKERERLMIALNNLLAAPAFETWRTGQPLDIEALTASENGRARLSIIYTAHLSDAERFFVTALVLDKVKTWMRRKGGTSELRALIYMDEIYGYFPPHPADPPTKRPLLTLLKQARAQGVGVVLATQNPVDIDYKGLANMGTWLVGKLQTEQDRARLRDGLLGAGGDAAQVDRLLDATRKRVFLLHDVHRPQPCLVHSRCTLSYLRGPFTRDDVTRLMGASRSVGTPAAQTPSPGAAPAPAQRAPAVAAETPQGPPIVPAPFTHHFLAQYGGELADPYVFVKYAVRYKGVGESVGLRAYPLSAASAAEVLEGEPLTFEEGKLAETAPAKVRYAELPKHLTTGAKGVEKALRERLPDKLAVTVLIDPLTKSISLPGETAEGFAARLKAGLDDASSVEKLRDKLEKKKRDLEARRQELSGRRTEKWVATGAAILSNIGLLVGKKRTISGASTVLAKNRMENSVEAKVAGLEAEVAELEGQLGRIAAVDAARFESQTLVPGRGEVKILRYDLVWVY